ncbi:MAG: extensin family protein [Pseudolabrys sp.]|nr:extensin family protein [Pseudolabrys sp.]
MKVGLRFLFGGTVVLLALAGCGRGMLQTGERESWRHQAEAKCMQSGAVTVGAGVVQMKPIEGPGMCGARYPLKVAALGTSSAIGYAPELRPPGSIPGGSAQMPRWPAQQPGYLRAPASQPMPLEPVRIAPVQSQPAPIQPAQGQMRWVPGPSGIAPPQVDAPQVTAPAGQPMSLSPPGTAAPQYSAPQYDAPRYQPMPQANEDDDIPDDAILPRGQAARQPVYNARPQRPAYDAPPQQRALPSLGPERGPRTTGAIMPAVVTPAATLSCPIVSALERWVTGGVQPAALHWFGSQVVEIKQISAYSCRGMVGAGTSRISEHAFGNALDVAGFVLADGRQIIIKKAWRGSPEEQGFLHDVQLFACQTFNTVLAPGYNAAHYDHFHFDLMRRKNGRRPCRPAAIPGEVVAARARAVYASKQRGPSFTGSISKASRGTLQDAIPGEDGYVDDEDDAVTGSIGSTGDDDDDAANSLGWPRLAPRTPPARQAAPHLEDRLSIR